MTNEEIKNKIADFEKRAKNPNLPSSAIAALEKKISELKSQISEEPKAPSAPSGKRGRPKGSVKSAPKKKGKRGRPAKQEKAPAKPKAKYKTEPKSDGSVPDCDELLKRWRERRQKAKDMGKKRRTKPVFTKISEGVVSAVEKAIKNVPKADIKAQPVRTVKKFEVLRDAADQFLKAFKSVLGEDYVKTEAEKELADLEGLISSLQEKYIKKYGDGGMMNADGDEEDMPVIRTQFEEEDYEYARGGGVGKIYEVGIDEGTEIGTRTLADFTTKKDAKDFMYDYQLKHPKAKLFIDTITDEYTDSRYAKGGGVGEIMVGDKVTLPEIKMPNSKVYFEKVENGEVINIEDGIYDVLNPKTKRIHRVTLDQIKFAKGGGVGDK
jgi:hypothetical protein